MPIELSNLKLKRVSTVDNPDNPDSEILLFKRHPDDGTDVTEPGTSEDDRNVNNNKGDADVSDNADLGTTAEDVQKRIDAAVEAAKEEAAAELKKAQDEKAEIEAALAKAKEDGESKEEVVKGLEERLSKMEDADRTRTALQKIKAWQDIPGMNEEFVPVVKAVSASAPGQWEKVEEMLDAANAAIGKSQELLEPSGGDGEGESDVEKKAEAKAEEFMKADPNMSKVDALAKAWEDPALFNAYNQERGR